MLIPDLSKSLTCTQSGTPLEAIAETTYTLTATDSNGDAAHLMFTLEVPDLMPTFGDATVAAQLYSIATPRYRVLDAPACEPWR